MIINNMFQPKVLHLAQDSLAHNRHMRPLARHQQRVRQARPNRAPSIHSRRCSGETSMVGLDREGLQEWEHHMLVLCNTLALFYNG